MMISMRDSVSAVTLVGLSIICVRLSLVHISLISFNFWIGGFEKIAC